jgi:lipopolysaccharide biosynthesis protein
MMNRVKKAIALIQNSPGLITDAIACLCYRLSKDALRFTVQTLKDLPTEPPDDGRRLVLFAHYDPQDEVDDYVRFYLEKLHLLGWTIIFVSGSPNLRPDSAAKIAPFCSGMYTRRTLSLDFGSWHLGWQQMKRRGWQLAAFDRLLLANDSVYGPLFDLTEMFSQFAGADMYGVTENRELSPHLQSYFLLWDLNGKTRTFIEDFWQEFRYVVRKKELIKRCEIGISQQARKCGLRQKAYISDAAARAVAAQHGDHEHMEEVSARSVNNSLYLWDVLIAHLRCPFLKTDLPRRNRYGSAKIQELSSFLERWTDYDPLLIEHNLERLGIKSKPA